MLVRLSIAGLMSWGCLLANLVQADDWPQWRGIGRDGVWQETGLVDELPDGQLPISWSVELGPGYAGPTVANGRVFVMDRPVSDRQTERVLCLDSASGEQLWAYEYDASYSIGYQAGPRASVTIDNGLAFAVGAMGHFHCFQADTGEIVWSHDLNAEYAIEMPIWGIAASPLIYGDLVIQQVGGANGACIVAFDKLAGKEVWRSLNERASYSSPIIMRQAGRDVLICWTADSLSGLDPVNGSVYWSHGMPPSRMPIGIGTPVVAGDLIFVSSFYDGSMMVRFDNEAMTSKVLWRAVGDDEQNTESLHAMIGTCIVQDGYVYGVDSYGEFRCLDAETGERIWLDQSAVPKARWATIHMVREAERVWMFNERGELLLTKLEPQGLSILDRCQLIEPTRVQLNQRGGVCWSHPAFAEKSVFVRNDQKLVKASLAKEQRK